MKRGFQKAPLKGVGLSCWLSPCLSSCSLPGTWCSYWCCSSNLASNQDGDTERNSRTPGVLPFRIPDYLRGRSHLSHYNWAQAFKGKAAWPITAFCWCCMERARTYDSDPDPHQSIQQSPAGLAVGGVNPRDIRRGHWGLHQEKGEGYPLPLSKHSSSRAQKERDLWREWKNWLFWITYI